MPMSREEREEAEEEPKLNALNPDIGQILVNFWSNFGEFSLEHIFQIAGHVFENELVIFGNFDHPAKSKIRI